MHMMGITLLLPDENDYNSCNNNICSFALHVVLLAEKISENSIKILWLYPVKINL